MITLFQLLWAAKAILLPIITFSLAMFMFYKAARKSGPLGNFILIVVAIGSVLSLFSSAGFLSADKYGYGYPYPESVQNIIDDDPNVSEDDVPLEAEAQRDWVKAYRIKDQRKRDLAALEKQKKRLKEHVEFMVKSEINRRNQKRIFEGKSPLTIEEADLLRPVLYQKFYAERRHKYIED